MRAALLLAMGAFLTAGPAGALAPLPDSPVLVVATNYTPNVIAVPSGGAVAWQSLEPDVGLLFHTVIGPGFFGDLPPGGSFRATIDAPAGSVLRYTCGFHSHMLGYIVVV